MFHQSHFSKAYNIDSRAWEFINLCADKKIKARLVGGCVRDALCGLGVPRTDIDIAVDCPPPEFIAFCELQQIKYIPTGIAHGTVTILFKNLKCEVTSLRAEIKTMGRHAHVVFGSSFEEDALRRDFTINALYVDNKHILYDAFEGVSHLANGKIKFIGDPGTRIAEDYLRLYRYFRFWGIFGRGYVDLSVLPTLDIIKENLQILSIERVQNELMRILSHPWPGIVVESMYVYGLFEHLFNVCGITNYLQNIRNLRRLIILEHFVNLTMNDIFYQRFCPIRRLSVLTNGIDVSPVLKLSRAQHKKFMKLLTLSNDIQRFEIALNYPEYWIDARLITLAISNEPIFVSRKYARVLESPPLFPLSGRDIIAMGVEGDHIGKILKAVKIEWIKNNFESDRKTVLRRAREFVEINYRSIN